MQLQWSVPKSPIFICSSLSGYGWTEGSTDMTSYEGLYFVMSLIDI